MPAQLVESIVGVVVEIALARVPGVPGEHLAPQPHELRRNRGGQFVHGLVADGCGFLREVTHRHIALEGDFAIVRRFAAQNEEEERRFPGAVGSNEADAILAVYLQRHIGEQRSPGESFGQSTDCQHPKRGMLRGSSVWGKRAVGAGCFGVGCVQWGGDGLIPAFWSLWDMLHFACSTKYFPLTPTVAHPTDQSVQASGSAAGR